MRQLPFEGWDLCYFVLAVNPVFTNSVISLIHLYTISKHLTGLTRRLHHLCFSLSAAGNVVRYDMLLYVRPGSPTSMFPRGRTACGTEYAQRTDQ